MQTLNDIAKEFEVSLQTVYNWKADAEQALGREIKGQKSKTDQRKIVYAPADVALIVGDRVAPGADAPTQPQPQTMRAGGLVPVADTQCTRTIALFDADQYSSDKQRLEDTTRLQAASLNEMVGQYAQSRIASVLADIDLVADSLRANALQQMGVQPGKPVGDDGSAA
jgi:hypothetical protein